MPLINNVLVLSALAQSAILEKKSLPGYSHIVWGDNDLEFVRSEIREFYRDEQRLICPYCLERVCTRSATGAPVEHIAPKSQYVEFMFEPKNLCVTCADCNEFKRNKEVFHEDVIRVSRVNYPARAEHFRIVHPHFDNYSDHLIKCNRIFIDISDKGTYTLSICKLNRFFHRFGASDELVEDLQLVEASERFFEEGRTESLIGGFR